MTKSTDQNPGTDSPVKQALREIRRLKAELASGRRAEAGPIAIIGMGVRLPGGADTPDAYWELLANGVNAVGPIPASRWEHERWFNEDAEVPGCYYVEHGGFLSEVDGFDPEFFGIAPAEAVSIDPQQRLLLETTWEALEHAGIPADSLRGSGTGVFVGISSTDYHRLVLGDEAPDTYAATGTAASVAAGRISYVLGLNGPALSVDTACSSSLVAVHLARGSLQRAESDLAVVGGVNLMLTPELTVNFCSAGMLSRDGRCKTFDAGADGYVRSEGCGVVVMKRLEDALRDGDRVHAVVRGSAVNQDGRSSGLTAPSGPAQEAVLRRALEDGGLAPNDLDYVEAHGTGTSLGDPIEVQAIGAVFGPGRPAERPLMIGSAKTNLGHLEAAAGIAGLIKVVLSLEHGEVPAHLHFETPNPHIPWDDLPVQVTTERSPWRAGDSVRRAGVSSFGFSGTNAHVILEEAPVRPDVSPPPARPAELLVLSAPEPEALRESVTRLSRHLNTESPALGDVCRTALGGRAHRSERLSVVAGDMAAARDALERWIDGKPVPEVPTGTAQRVTRGSTVFAFAGDGSPSPETVRELATASSHFRRALERCDAALRPIVGDSLLDLFEHPAPPSVAQPAQFAVLYATAALWSAAGIRPDVVLGDGVGEYVAAHLAGAFSLDDALRLVAARGRDADAGVAASGVTAHRSELEEALDSVDLRATDRLRFISGVTGAAVTPEAASQPAYWLRQVRAPSKLAEAVDTAGRVGVAAGVRIGVARSRPDGPLGEWLASGLDSDAPWETVLQGLGELFVGGRGLDVEGLFAERGGVPLPLPTYPFQRRRFWYEPTVVRGAPSRSRSTSAGGPDAPWTRALDSAAERSELVPMGMDVDGYSESWAALNELTRVLWSNTLVELGAFPTDGGERTAAEAIAAAGIQPAYERVAARWIDVLVESGALVRSERGLRPGPTLEVIDPAELQQRAEEALSGDLPLWRYVRHSAGLLTPVVSGGTSALETLFPGGSFDLAASLYHDSTLLRYVNGIGASALSAYVGALPVDSDVRVLEIGAGTGGTTASLVRVLPAERTDYLYTDVSDVFLDFAERRFEDVPFLRTGILDLEKDPEGQGVEPGAWDVVVAANVVHAARDLRAAVGALRSLLAPGGLLLLVESTGHHPWHDISTGLIEGWQHFADDLREESPLLPTEVWEEVLREAGFDDFSAFPREDSPASVLKQHVLLARVPGEHVSSRARRAAGTEKQEPGAAQGGPTGSAFVEGLSQAPAEEREELLEELVRDRVIQVLRADPSRPPARDTRLMDLGLDSLMAVRLRNLVQEGVGLAEPLPSTLVFDYPTIRRIARFVLTRIEAGDGERGHRHGEPMPSPTGPAVPRAEVESLSDEEVEAMLLERLEPEEGR